MMILASMILLIVIALIHFYWALGGNIGLDRALPTDLDGNRLLNPPQPLSALVGLLVFGFAFVAYKLYVGGSENYIVYSGWVIGIIFLLRALGDFRMVGVFKKIKGTPFSVYDTWFYVPLCLFIGLSFIIMLF